MPKWTALICLSILLIGTQATPAAADPYLYITPTVGIWKWDKETAPLLDLKDRAALVLGGRAGYSPIDAFSGELVVLTGANDATVVGRDSTLSLRETLIEVSFLVNFQTLVSSPIYPYLDLGAGVALRRGGGEINEKPVFNNTNFVFHLGGGLKAQLSSKLALRANVRDTFFTETQGEGNEENQVTVDSVEISLGLEYRIPLARGRGSRRLR